MRKNITFKSFLVVTCIILFVFMAISLISTVIRGVPVSPPMFENINEFQLMLANISEDASFDLYTDISKDSYIKDLNCDSFFAGKYKSPTFEFEIFAYEFSNSNSAKKYIFNHGLNNNLETTYHASFGMFGKCKFVVVNKNQAYTVITKNNEYDYVNDFLSSNLSLIFDNGEYVFK